MKEAPLTKCNNIAQKVRKKKKIILKKSESSLNLKILFVIDNFSQNLSNFKFELQQLTKIYN
jgi:hypothetical protein